MSGSEILEEIEELPDRVEAVEEGAGEVKPQEPYRPVEPVKPAAVEVKPAASALEEFRRKVEELKSVLNGVTSAARELSGLQPEQIVLASKLVDKLLTSTQASTTEARLQPPAQEELLRRGLELYESRVSRVERKVSEVSEAMRRYEDLMARMVEALDKASTIASENQKLREEVERLRRSHEAELEKIRKEYIAAVEKLREEYGVILKHRAREGDKVYEEFDLHPRLKYLDRQADFTFTRMGPALIEEIRSARAEMSTVANRLITLFESIIAPELKRRAPRIVEDMEDRFRRLVGRLSPEERERELAELESRIAETTEVEEEGEGGEEE